MDIHKMGEKVIRKTLWIWLPIFAFKKLFREFMSRSK